MPLSLKCCYKSGILGLSKSILSTIEKRKVGVRVPYWHSSGETRRISGYSESVRPKTGHESVCVYSVVTRFATLTTRARDYGIYVGLDVS